MNGLVLLVEMIENLKRSRIKKTIDSRMKEFERIGKKGNSGVYKELCYCLLTANFSAARSMEIQKEIGNGFLIFSKDKLGQELSKLGHRFPFARANYIIESRKYKDSLKEILNSFDNEESARKWLVENIKGLGFKEASHFLRNIGYNNVAIIDFHIIDLLIRYGLLKKPNPRTMTKYQYLEIENVLKDLAEKTGLGLGELDLYLWYEETGKILK